MIFDNKIDKSLLLITKIDDKSSLNIYKIVNNIPDNIKEEISNNLDNIELGKSISSSFNNNNYLSYKYIIDYDRGIKVLTIIEYYKNSSNSNNPLMFNFGFSLISYDNKSVLDLNDFNSLPIGKIKIRKNNTINEYFYTLKSYHEKFLIQKRMINNSYKRQREILKIDIPTNINKSDIYVRTLFKY